MLGLAIPQSFLVIHLSEILEAGSAFKYDDLLLCGWVLIVDSGNITFRVNTVIPFVFGNNHRNIVINAKLFRHHQNFHVIDV